MGLLAKLFNDASDAEFKLAQDLVGIAMADGEISDAERKMITEICQSEGISDDTMQDCLMGLDKDINNQIPDKRREKADYLSKLIRVMGVDGYSSHMEIYLLELIASKMGVGHMELVSLVLMTATRRNFPGETGSKALASFLKNVIDPKSKSLRNNRDNIRKLFDLIAENVPLPQVHEGDILAVLCTGAYNYSMASHYNRLPRPAMIALRGEQSIPVIRRETWADLTAMDIL